MFTAATPLSGSICVTIGFLLIGTSALAADASPWVGDSRSGARLIAGKKAPAETPVPILRAGVEIRLAPGWKTYWRYPGDSGVPPKLDFAGSDNVKSVSVLWPAPQRFADSDGNTIGYKTNVIFPVHVQPADPARPVVLRLVLDYAICEKICIPAEAKGELALTGDGGSNDAAIAAAERRVPVTTEAGKAGSLSIQNLKRESGANPPRLLVDVTAPDGKVDLFVEGPTPEWALPLPAPVEGAPAGAQRFAFVLDGLPGGAKVEGAQLKFTAVTPDQAIETVMRLD